MISTALLQLFIRDINKLKEELNLYTNESDIWVLGDKTNNSAGTLTLHLIGNLKHYIGARLGGTSYIRNREMEFLEKYIPKTTLLKDLEDICVIIEKTLVNISDETLQTTYPDEFLGKKVSVGELLITIYSHLNYHLGQINYHRRLLA